MTTKQEQLLSNHNTEIVFEVDYSTIRESRVIILDIINACDFRYRYKDGKLLNFPIRVHGTCWNPVEMYIYNN